MISELTCCWWTLKIVCVEGQPEQTRSESRISVDHMQGEQEGECLHRPVQVGRGVEALEADRLPVRPGDWGSGVYQRGKGDAC